MTILQSAIAQSAAGGGSYQISRSLRFNSADSPYLTRTPASATNRQIFTYSLWVKNSCLPSTIQRIFGVGVTNYFGIDIGYSAGEFNINVDLGPDATRSQNYTTATFRDPSAWYHFVIAVDTTQATTANRLKIYVNNVLYSYSSTASIPQNLSTDVNNTVVHNIGRRVDGSDRYCSLYMTEINLIDGQQLTPSSFGQTDSATGVWNPIAYTGTYGTNGFYVNFSDNSGTTSTTLGKDYSGNSNNWTPNNFSVTAGTGNDSLVDTPTNYGTDTGVGGEVRGNYAIWNAASASGSTFTNGSLDVAIANNGLITPSTFFPSSGKWYCEVLWVSGDNPRAGVTTQAGLSGNLGSTANSWANLFDSRLFYNNSTTTYGVSLATGDVLTMALDLDAGKLWYGKNGTWMASGDPATGANPSQTFTANQAMSFAVSSGGGVPAFTGNFGQRAFAYTVPSGFKAIVTQNLPTPTVGATSSTLANDYFDVSLWTGAGQTGTASITGLAFQPDFVWAKQRSGGTSNLLYDVIRGPSTSGASKALVSNATATEGSSNDNSTYGYLSAFNSDGFSYYGGSSPTYFSANGNTYVGWQWKGGGTGVTNTSGSITSTVSANPTSGFSIVTYTGTGSTATVGHGIGIAPQFIIVKQRGTSGGGDGNWLVGATAAIGWTGRLILNGTQGNEVNSTHWNDTAPTSTVFTLGTAGNVNGNTGSYVAYCFAPVTGFSRFTSFVGNGSTDGPFVYCGFRPRFILIKDIVGADSAAWLLYDTARSTYNVSQTILCPNLPDADNTNSAWNIDILSNGFKMRSSYGQLNNNNSTYLVAAFAESPFNYSRAR